MIINSKGDVKEDKYTTGTFTPLLIPINLDNISI